MRRFRAALLTALVLAGMALASGGVGAKNPANLFAAQGDQDEAAKKAEENFGWDAFQDPKKIGRFLLLLMGSAALGAILAYHPYSRRSTLEDLDQPKITITYAVVGTLVGIVVPPVPAMGIAIFGIGGLMRFRTELGAAKETGRVILATMIGITCGLNLWMVAILSTVLAWVLIFILESRVNLRLVVRGVRSDTIGQSADAYAKVLRSLKCSFRSPRKNPGKGQLSFNLQHRRGLGHEEIEAHCNSEIPKELRGTIDWPEE